MRSSAVWPELLLCALLTGVAGCEPARGNVELEIVALGTISHVSLYEVTNAEAAAARAALEELFIKRGRDWYPWADGELSRINAAFANGEPVAVEATLAALLRRAADFESRSDGRFNAGLGRLTEAWGLHTLAAPTQPADSAIEAILADAPGVAGIRWAGDVAHSPSQLLMVDLGGIGKGALVAESLATLSELGIGNAIVNLGGDLAVMGTAGGRAARIGIRAPEAAGALAGLEVGDGEAVFTSGTYERFVEIDGRRYAHVLDPQSGYPVAHSVSATVVHADPVLADAAATALLVGGPDAFDALVAAFELEFALLIPAQGDLRLTPGLAERLHWSRADPS